MARKIARFTEPLEFARLQPIKQNEPYLYKLIRTHKCNQSYEDKNVPLYKDYIVV